MSTPVLPLRRRNRLATMRQVQENSVTLIEERGFEATTIEAIAEVTGISPSTIYRHFGTKENLVLWDEQDDTINAALARNLALTPPRQAFRDAVVAGLTNRPDQHLFLRRLRLVYGVPSIWAAAAHHDRLARHELAGAIAQTAGRDQISMTDAIVAATCLTALDVALEEWQSRGGQPALGALIDQAMAAATAPT